MKTLQNKIILSLSVVFMLFTLVSCDKDGDFITAELNNEITLGGTDGDIILSVDAANDLALTIYWTDNGEISLSNPQVQAPKNATTNTVQLSSNSEFLNPVEKRAEDGVFQEQFTHSELNAFLSRLGMEGGIKYPLYIRIKSSVAENIEPTFSNILSLNVTPFLINMSIGYVLDSDQNETGRTLYSASSNGIYEGFLGVTSWYNWYLREGEGTIWGNDGIDGTPFLLSKESSQYNFWFPGKAGCYYTIVDTKAEEWSSLHIPSLTVSGDINGEMTFDRSSNTWTYSFDNNINGTLNITISRQGQQYNLATGTDDDNAIDTAIGFSGTADNLSFSNSAKSISVPANGTGEVSLVLNLSNPEQWTVEITEGSATPVEIPQLVYISGIDDGISGDWTFDNFLRLFDENNLSYGGAANVNSLWGYKFFDEAGNWDDAYAMADGGTPLEGSLEFKGENNIVAPDLGLYIIEMSKKNLNYKLTAVNSISYSGFDDDWNLYQMLETDVPGVYTAEVTIAGPSPWGFSIVVNEDWDIKFGGSNGELILYGQNLTEDANLSAGTYTLTVDICKQTISLE